MEAVNALYQRSLILPTGAQDPTPRIVEDGTTSTILVYGTGGALIASIASVAGTDGLGNNYPAGISASAGVISQSIILLYSGTPAVGNLIMSMAAAAGADSFGNAYIAGLGTYAAGVNTYQLTSSTGNLRIGTAAAAHWLFDVVLSQFSMFDLNGLLTARLSAQSTNSNLLWLFNSAAAYFALSSGGFQMGLLTTPGAVPTPTDQANAAAFSLISGTSPALQVLTNRNSADPGSARVLMQVVSGNNVAGKPGSLDNSKLLLQSTGVTGASTDIALGGGALYRQDLSGQQAPAYNANWSASTTFNGSSINQPLQFCVDGMDNLAIGGAFKTGAVAGGASVFNLPATYRPKNNMWVSCTRNNGGAISKFDVQITTGGNFNIVATMGGGIAASNEYWIEPCVVPLGNLP